MTVNLDERFGVTVSEERRLGRGFVAVGRIFDRRTGLGIGVTVRGEGRTWPAAADRAVAAARAARPSEV